MEQIINLVSEAPFLVKLFIAYAMILILVFLGNLIGQLINSNYFKRDFFKESIKLSFWILLISIFLTGCAWLFFRGWKVFYIISFACGVFYILTIVRCISPEPKEHEDKAKDGTSTKSNSSYSRSSYRPIAYTSRPVYRSSFTESTKPSATLPKPSNQSPKVVPVILPESKSQQPTDTPAGFHGNMADIENKVRNGISVRLDYQLCWSRIDNALKMASKSGAKITFYNIPPIRSNTVCNMIAIAKQAPGLVYFEESILAGSEAEQLAASGACFTCDCSSGSSCIRNIAANARKSNGRIIFVNSSRLDYTAIRNIKEAGGDNIEIK